MCPANNNFDSGRWRSNVDDDVNSWRHPPTPAWSMCRTRPDLFDISNQETNFVSSFWSNFPTRIFLFVSSEFFARSLMFLCMVIGMSSQKSKNLVRFLVAPVEW